MILSVQPKTTSHSFISESFLSCLSVSIRVLIVLRIRSQTARTSRNRISGANIKR